METFGSLVGNGPRNERRKNFSGDKKFDPIDPSLVPAMNQGLCRESRGPIQEIVKFIYGEFLICGVSLEILFAWAILHSF